jgi:hypothetical protein
MQTGGASSLPLTQDSFRDHLGAGFIVHAREHAQELRLVEVQELPNSQRRGGGFRLEFEGSQHNPLPQAAYAFTINGAVHDIFIVPVGLSPTGAMRYEAIFY